MDDAIASIRKSFEKRYAKYNLNLDAYGNYVNGQLDMLWRIYWQGAYDTVEYVSNEVFNRAGPLK